MIKPLAQLVTGSDILQPSFQPQRCLLYAARPETVHQEARPVAGCRRFVNSLDLNHVKNLSPGSRLATRDCTTRPRLNSWRMNRLRSLTVVLAGLASWNKQFSISGEMDFPLFYRKKIVRTLLVACCAAFPGFHAGAAPDLAVGSTSACPDSNGTVPVNFVAGAGVVSLQFDLQFEDAKLISGTPVGGSALADHQVASNVVTNGLLRVLIFSFSNTPLTNGV